MLRDWRKRRGDSRPPRADFIREVLPTGGGAAELGVHRGDFAAELLDLAKPERLHLVDLWYLFGHQWHWGEGKERSTIGALKGVLDRFEDDLVAGRVVLHIGDDLELLPSFPDGYFDWVYVDSVHVYEHAQRELALLAAKVRPGGVIAGDDWIEDPSHPHHGVSKAVSEFAQGGGGELVYSSADDLQWALRLPPAG
ncbi:MAG TPA: class I SAM-dependent methyltransferase [Solirubrobacterales bacterium]|nr:class I SAM-dependent methyltransferase [Solirubrobacterales bacterium]